MTSFRIKYLEQIYDYVGGFSGVPHRNGEQILDWCVKARTHAGESVE